MCITYAELILGYVVFSYMAVYDMSRQCYWWPWIEFDDPRMFLWASPVTYPVLQCVVLINFMRKLLCPRSIESWRADLHSLIKDFDDYPSLDKP